MKTKSIIARFFFVLIILISFYLHSCKRDEWCADCEQYDCRDILYEKVLDIKTICADSKAECLDSIMSFHVKYYTTCWDCSEPYRK
jgi:hypothetical protein